jgi:hypothetical protein
MRVEELREMCEDTHHHGHGFSVAYRTMTGVELAVAEKMVLARSQHLGLNRGQLFLWLDSKHGRWFTESVQSRNAEAIQTLMTVEIIEELTQEAADDIMEGLVAWLS